MSTLERAISIAAEAHAGQGDKAGERLAEEGFSEEVLGALASVTKQPQEGG